MLSITLRNSVNVMSETCQRILYHARRLFNEHGVSNVTMRSIAAEVNISVGNLTYYYPRKKDLVRALMTDDIEETMVHEPMSDLQKLNNIFEGMLKSLQRNPFFFLDDQARTMIGNQESDNLRQVHGQIDPVLDALISDGMLKREFQGQVRLNVMLMILYAHMTWLKSLVRPGPLPSLTLEEMLNAHWTVLTPWLTEAGKQAKENMKSNK